MSNREPGHGRYAHVEREQRWTAVGLPLGARRTASITDRYVVGTRMRVRVAETAGEATYKLAQKVRVDPADPEVVLLTNIYLSAEEHTVLASLPAAELCKTRWTVSWAGRSVAIDQFHGRLERLFLAEVELSPEEGRLELPPFAVAEVTDDDRFSGGSLASASHATTRALLDGLGIAPHS